jgi:bifunctional DNA-binding transcriptional regulator/antitoxin component of YhaV-PrlF toxin-antitoxin module
MGVLFMPGKYKFRFFATVSDRGQIFIPKVLQEYFDIHKRDRVEFLITDEGNVVFKKKGEER